MMEERGLILSGPDRFAMGGEPPACPSCGGGMEVFLDGHEHCSRCEPQFRNVMRFRNAAEILPRPRS